MSRFFLLYTPFYNVFNCDVFNMFTLLIDSGQNSLSAGDLELFVPTSKKAFSSYKPLKGIFFSNIHQ